VKNEDEFKKETAKIEGEGTLDTPFNATAYITLTSLKEDPFCTLDAIKEALKEHTEIFTNIEGYHRHPEAQNFRKGLTWRLDLPGLRYSNGAGTSFVMIKLKEKGLDFYDKFESDIATKIPGVIEWDQIPGRSADYLVRIVGKVGDEQTLRISETINRLDNVQDVYIPPELAITRSGVVDNFQPEDFLAFSGQAYEKLRERLSEENKAQELEAQAKQEADTTQEDELKRSLSELLKTHGMSAPELAKFALSTDI